MGALGSPPERFLPWRTIEGLQALLLVFFADDFFGALPFDAEGRIGQHIVEGFARVAVVGEGVAGFDLADVLPFDEHVGFADGVAFVVELLADHDDARAEFFEVFARDREHAAGAGGGVVDGADNGGFGENVVVLNEEEVGHEADDVARGEVVAGGFVGLLGEFADELFKDGAHVGVGDAVGVEIDGGEFFGDEVEEVGFLEAVDLGGEFEAVEDVGDVGREGVQVAEEIGGDVVGVARDGLQVHGRGVVEGVAGGAAEEVLGGGIGVRVFLRFGEHGGFSGGEDAIHAAEDGEGQDDAAVFVGFVFASEKVGDGPEEGGEIHGEVTW